MSILLLKKIKTVICKCVFSKECKYIDKEVIRHIIEALEISLCESPEDKFSFHENLKKVFQT